jgi:SAM-dependent methyltransferase
MERPVHREAPVERARRITNVLRRGGWVEDGYFDRLLSEAMRDKSASFWSSVSVAQTAAKWLAEAGCTRVLDVGAGVGKFCAVASLTTGRRFWGLEQRGALVFEARKLAQALTAEVVMVEGGLSVIEPHRFDGFYFYNPFAEHIADKYERLDDSLVCSADDYLRDARTVERWLRAARVGTAMVTYNGLGGRIPCSWKSEREQRLRGNLLRLWVKRGEDVSNDAFIEVEDRLVSAGLLAQLVKQSPRMSMEDALVARLVEPEGA